MSHKAAVALVAHDDHYFLGPTLASWHSGLPTFVFLSESSWIGDSGDWRKVERIAKAAGATVVKGNWPGEELHRNSSHDWLRNNGFTYALTPDGDEIIEPPLLQTLLTLASNGLADRVYVEWDTYFGGENFVIRPREKFTPIMLVNLEVAKYERVREFSSGRALLLNDAFGIVHHLSYAGPDERIQRKIITWGHREEVQKGWYENIWERFKADPFLRNLHPTHPDAYQFAEHIHAPEILRKFLGNQNNLSITEGQALAAKAATGA